MWVAPIVRPVADGLRAMPDRPPLDFPGRSPTSLALRGSSGTIYPGAYKICKGAVPDRGRGLGHTAPTYTRRDQAGSPIPTASAALDLSSLRPADLQARGR